MHPDLEAQSRLAYLNFEDSDRALLAELRPILDQHADYFVDAFYRHLLGFEETRRLLVDPAVKQRLLGKQREYLLSLADPAFDADYVAERRRIGEVHARIGLEPRWFLGAYSLYFSLLIPLVGETFDVEHAQKVINALQRILFFDAQVAIESYIQRSESQLEYMTEELAAHGQRLARDFEDQGSELRQTTRRARAAEQLASIGTLVAGLAHEIGTPMGVIQGHAKLLESAVGDSDARWRLETIQEQIGRISRIIETLLNMARPGPSRRTLSAVEPILTNTLSFVSDKLARRGIEVDAAFDAVPSIQANPERLQQLFLNLVMNAVDAMPKGGRLRISLRSSDAEIQVRVADSGVGIAPPELSRIFDPFFTTKAAGEGNGLGLMVAKGIVEDHGGSIEVESSPNAGTQFCIHLPVPEA